MSAPFVVVASGPSGLEVFGPFDEDEAGAVCAAAIAHGAEAGSLQVLPLRGVSTASTFRIAPGEAP
jgi:hypothetical protein